MLSLETDELQNLRTQEVLEGCLGELGGSYLPVDVKEAVHLALALVEENSGPPWSTPKHHCLEQFFESGQTDVS